MIPRCEHAVTVRCECGHRVAVLYATGPVPGVGINGYSGAVFQSIRPASDHLDSLPECGGMPSYTESVFACSCGRSKRVSNEDVGHLIRARARRTSHDLNMVDVPAVDAPRAAPVYAPERSW